MRELSPGQHVQNLLVIDGENLANRLAGHGIDTIGRRFGGGNISCSFCQSQAYQAPIVDLQNRMTED